MAPTLESRAIALFRALVGALGAVAQLGERLVRNEEVRGSIPLGSTSLRRFAATAGKPHPHDRPQPDSVLRHRPFVLFWFARVCATVGYQMLVGGGRLAAL